MRKKPFWVTERDKRSLKSDHINKVLGEKNVIHRKKSDIVHSEKIMTKHHRRPRALDGSNFPSNISMISNEIHKAWTLIMGDMSAEQICNHINIHFKPRSATVICIFINGHRCKKAGAPGTHDEAKISYAWRILFKDCRSFKSKIDFINSTLLDPSYHLYIRY
ncbi:MAG: hypothetical protein WCQ32_01440 [bacterium]